MTCVKLDSDEVPAYSARRDKRGAGVADRIKAIGSHSGEEF